MRPRILKRGNDLAVKIPQNIADPANLRAGDFLEIHVVAETAIQTYRKAQIPTLAQLVAQITADNRHREIASGADVRREVVEW